MTHQAVESILDTLRPVFARDGGGIELVSVDAEKGIVTVALQGACRGCPMSQVTLKMVVEGALRDQFPEITQVIAVDDILPLSSCA